MRTFTTTLGIVALVGASISCGDVARQGRGGSFLVIDFLTAASGATSSEFGGTLQSDVVTNVEVTIDGEQVLVPTIFEDIGQVQMRILLKDQGNPGAEASPSSLNAITVNRYHVSYRRSVVVIVSGVVLT
jgi:hypothetical protein